MNCRFFRAEIRSWPSALNGPVKPSASTYTTTRQLWGLCSAILAWVKHNPLDIKLTCRSWGRSFVILECIQVMVILISRSIRRSLLLGVTTMPSEIVCTWKDTMTLSSSEHLGGLVIWQRFASPMAAICKSAMFSLTLLQYFEYHT